VLHSGQPGRPVQRDLGDPVIITSGRREHAREATQSPDLTQAGCASHGLEPARELGWSHRWADLDLGGLAERLLVLDELLVLLPAEVSVRRAQSGDAILDRGHELVFRLAGDVGEPHRLNEEPSRALVGSLLEHGPPHTDLLLKLVGPGGYI